MRVLIACEFSGVVRDAFAARGHDAWSCDLLPSEKPGNHLHGSVLDVLGMNWDLLIAFPPCTYLCNSGVRWLYKGGKGNKRNEFRWCKMVDAAEFFRQLWLAPIPRIAIENPRQHRYATRLIGVLHSQAIQPWMFGHGETKETRLWLKNLPLLTPTDIVSGRVPRVHRASPGPNRWKERSRTLPGIANAMAEQWSQ